MTLTALGPDENNGTVRHRTDSGWLFECKHSAISKSAELDRIQTEFNAPALPTMVFGENFTRIFHPRSGFCLEFNTESALRTVDWGKLPLATGVNDGNDSGLKPPGSLVATPKPLLVAVASEWQKSRYLQTGTDSNNTRLSSIPMIRPFDWTFTPQQYRGNSSTPFLPGTTEIDFERLKNQREPIEMYDENVLYEDELADNGLAQLTVRLRVMPSCFLVLQRYYLHLQHVLLRSVETRVYCGFDSGQIIREYTVRESNYNYYTHKIINRFNHNGDRDAVNIWDQSQIQTVCSLLPVVNRELEQISLA